MLQVEAAKALLIGSGLILFDEYPIIAPSEDFTKHWQNLEPKLGRLMCWIWFGAGAEYLIKGYLLSVGVEIRKEIETGKVDSGSMKTANAKLQKRIAMNSSLADVYNHYKEMNDVRNRDSHYRIEGVRDENYESLKTWVNSLDYLYRQTQIALST